MGKSRIVGISGPAGCGKSTARLTLEQMGWRHVSMAGVLKSMARVFFESAGLNDEVCINGRLKETPLQEIGGVSPRHVMQTLGSEWGRDLIAHDIWVQIAKSQCVSFMSKGFDVVIDDIRFENEAEMVRSLGGSVVKITGRGGISGVHVSEMGVTCDLEIKNIGTECQFKTDILYILHRTDF
jgi:cytidylate kinase